MKPRKHGARFRISVVERAFTLAVKPTEGVVTLRQKHKRQKRVLTFAQLVDVFEGQLSLL